MFAWWRLTTDVISDLQGVDQSVGFDIEVKMATPPELAVTPPQEVERMVAPILEAVQAVATHSSRPIIFSSFDPEICRCLPCTTLCHLKTLPAVRAQLMLCAYRLTHLETGCLRG